MSPLLRSLLLDGRFNPYSLPNNSAIYSLDGPEGASTYLTNGSGRVMLVADRSGNSAVNGLITNGTTGNYASLPSSASLNIGATFCVVWDGILVDWTPSSVAALCAKFNSTGNKRQYFLNVLTDGKLRITVDADGTGSSTTTLDSSVATGFTDMARGAVRVDYDGAVASATFYTAPTKDGPWTQLGTVPTGTARTPYSSDTPFEINAQSGGSDKVTIGQCFACRLINGTYSGGTVVLDVDFTRTAKLAGSFTESSSNAATVTINTSGDTGARICGARDLYQGTTTKMPALSNSGGYNIATFDGSNDYLKAAPFTLSQPESVYFVGSQVTWTQDDGVFDGNADVTMLVYQNNASPRLDLFAGTNLANSGLATATRAVIRAVFNGNSSSLAFNRSAASTGAGGSSNGGGFAVGARGGGGSNGNITFSEGLVRSVADDAATQLRIAGFLIRKWGIAA